MDFYGDNFRWFIGTVIAVDSLAVGKVKIRIHGIHGPDITDDNLPFADVMLPSTEAGVSGIGKIPQLLPSSFVFGVFVDGKNSQAPLVLGSLGKFEKPTDIQKVIAGQAGNAAQFSSGNLSSDGAFISPDLVSAYDNGNSSLAQKRVIMMQFFTGNGFTANQAAGIIGNLQQESLNVDTGENFDPTVISKGSEDSIGLAQWNAAAAAGYRKNKLFNYAAQQKKDPLDFFLQYYNPLEVLSAVRTIKEYAQANGGTVMYTISEGAHEQKIHSQLEAICDLVIQLEVGRMAAEFENRLIIKKIRNHPEKAAVMIYAVTDSGLTPEMITRVALWLSN